MKTKQDDSNSAMDNSRVTTLNKIADFLSQFSLIGSASAAELPALGKAPTPTETNESAIKTDHPEVAHQKIDYAAELYHYLGALEKGAHFINVPIPEQIKTIRQLIGAFGRNIDNSNIDGSIAMYPDLPAKLANRISTIKKRVGSSADTSVQQVEDAISQFVGGATQVGIDMVVAKFCALWKLPTVGLSMYKAAAVQATCGATFGITAQHFTTSFAKTGGDLMEKGCKKFFDAKRERQNDTSGCSKMVPPDYAGFDVPYFPPLTPKVIPDNEVNEAEKEVVGDEHARSKNFHESFYGKPIDFVEAYNDVAESSLGREIGKNITDATTLVRETLQEGLDKLGNAVFQTVDEVLSGDLIFLSDNATEQNTSVPTSSSSDAPIKIEQELPMLTCMKNKSQHRFVTPNFISNRDIEKSNTSDEFIYVITEKGQLKMAKKQSLSTDDSGQYLPATHTDLARGKKVMGVGTIQVQQGKITRVSHGAPDYEPEDGFSLEGDVSLKSTTKQAFEARGLKFDADVFVDESSHVSFGEGHSSSTATIPEVKSRVTDSNEGSSLSSYSMFATALVQDRKPPVLRKPVPPTTTPHFEDRKANFNALVSRVQTPAPKSNQAFFGAGNNAYNMAQQTPTVSTFNVSTLFSYVPSSGTTPPTKNALNTSAIDVSSSKSVKSVKSAPKTSSNTSVSVVGGTCVSGPTHSICWLPDGTPYRTKHS